MPVQKKKQSKLNKITGLFNPRSLKGGIALFALIFALGGGVYFVYRSFASTCVDYTFKAGSSGQCVLSAQQLANHKLPYIEPKTKISADGKYSAGTKAAIVRIQKQWGLDQTGEVNIETWKALCSSGTVNALAGGPFNATAKKASINAGCGKFYGKKSCVDRTYALGSNGACVLSLQQLANHKLTVSATGTYDSQTKSAIEEIQKRWEIQQTGTVNNETWKALCNTGTAGPEAGGEFDPTAAKAYITSGCEMLNDVPKG